jgi:DNA-binding NtrC family response regulator
VLVVDDDGDIRMALEMRLSYEGFEVWTARDGQEALARVEREALAGQQPAVVLADVKMPRLDGLGLLEALVQRASPPAVIMISGHGDVATAVDAVRRGAVDFIEKPLDENRLLVAIQSALRGQRLERENTGLRRQLSERWSLVGESAPMRALREQIGRVAGSDAAVLLSGENGTGKEVVARQIHLESPRAAGPFVAVNCAAIPAELIESELFGHEKGSFTGAHERRIGHFEAASGGTLFLDEIGDMPAAAQAKVLRALETHEITRVGGNRALPVDIRVISATNADLAQAVEDKTFRVDLFYRLNVVPLRVPPLRERLDDVPLLIDHFIARNNQRLGTRIKGIDPSARKLLLAHRWPGNVRELENLIERAVVLAESEHLTAADMPAQLHDGTDPVSSVLSSGDLSIKKAAATIEESLIRRALEQTRGNRTAAARLLEISHRALLYKIKDYKLGP